MSSRELEQTAFHRAEPEHPLVLTAGSPSTEESEESEEECWDLEYEDWHRESRDFTKKLNAVRAGHLGANTQQVKGDSGSGRTISQKAIQVDY